MAINEQIKLDIDDSLVTRSLNAINGMINKINRNKLTLGNSVNQTTQSLNNASGASKAFGHALLRFAFSSLVVVRQAMNAFNSGLKDLEEGLRRVIQLDAGFMFKGLARDIQNASFGFLDLNQAMSFAKGMEGLKGGTDELAKSMARLSTIAFLTNPTGIKDSEQAFERMQKAFITGQPTKELASVSKELYDQVMLINKSIPLWDILGRRQAFAAAIMKVSAQEAKRFGFMLNDPFFKLLEVINKIKNSLKGMGQILTGLSSIALGVLGPLGVGMSAFAFGPVAGIIGTIVGGILSVAIGTFTVKALNKLGEKDDGIVKAIERLMFFLKGIFAPLGSPKGDKNGNWEIIIPEGAYPNNEAIKQAALDAVSVGRDINKFANKISNFGKGTFDFVGGLVESFKKGYNFVMNDKVKEVLKNLTPPDISARITPGDVAGNIFNILATSLGLMVGGIDLIGSFLMKIHDWAVNTMTAAINQLIDAVKAGDWSKIPKLLFDWNVLGKNPLEEQGRLELDPAIKYGLLQLRQPGLEFSNFNEAMASYDTAAAELRLNKSKQATNQLQLDPTLMASAATPLHLELSPHLSQLVNTMDEINLASADTLKELKKQTDMWRRDQADGQ